MRQRWLLVIAGVASAAGVALAAGPAASSPAAARVDPRVVEDTANGRTASFLVVGRARPAAALALAQHADHATQGHLVTDALRDAAAESQGPILALLRRHRAPHRAYWVANVVAVTGGRDLVEVLARLPEVEAIEPNRVFRGIEATAAEAAPTRAAAIEWNVLKINADKVWALGFTGQGMVYANADTGVRWTHSALKSQYRGWNGTTADHNYNWWDAIHSGGGACGPNTQQPCDDNNHGTHTMGTAVGNDGAGNQIGVAPGAKWISCRNMDQGNGTPATYIECFQFFMAPTNLLGGAPDPNLRPHVVGNSYSCPPSEGCSVGSLQTAVDNLRAAGVFMAVSAGNEGPACSTVKDPPGIYDSSITVGATDMNDLIASFSSRGPVTSDGSNRRKPDVVAPGVSVRSSLKTSDTSYGVFSGTSMAAPHVGGEVLLLWSAFPALRRDVNRTEEIVAQSAVHLLTNQGCGGDTGTQTPNNTYGHGRIDALAAYNLASQPPTSVATLTAADASVAEGNAGTRPATVVVRLSGTAGPARVAYRTVNGTAVAGRDYAAVSGTLVFGAREREKRVRIQVVGDRVREPNEVFSLVLSRPANATLARARAKITIRNDDPARPRR